MWSEWPGKIDFDRIVDDDGGTVRFVVELLGGPGSDLTFDVFGTNKYESGPLTKIVLNFIYGYPDPIPDDIEAVHTAWLASDEKDFAVAMPATYEKYKNLLEFEETD